MRSFTSYDLIVFDLDGTLTDPESGLIRSFVYALERMGVDTSDREALRAFIGPPLFSEWQKVYGFDEAQATRALSYFHEYFGTRGWSDNRVYEGMIPLLQALRAQGKTLAVATSKPEHYARMILDRFDLACYFDCIAGALNERERDKKWEVLSFVLSQYPDVALSRVLMVGDRKYDAEGARRCGVDAVGVAWGHGSAGELADAGFLTVMQTPEDLKSLLVGK